MSRCWSSTRPMWSSAKREMVFSAQRSHTGRPARRRPPDERGTRSTGAGEHLAPAAALARTMCCCLRHMKTTTKVAMAAALVVTTLLLNAAWPAVFLGRSQSPLTLQLQQQLHDQQQVLTPVGDGDLAAQTAVRLRQLRQSLADLERQKRLASTATAEPPSRLRSGVDGGTARSRPPHILFVLADDLGSDDLSLSQPLLKTPVLHGLATRGLFLQNYYSQSLCSPSRAALHTGRWPARFGMQTYVLLDEQRYGMDLGEATLPERLQRRHGYRTHLMGKWHQGYHSWRHTPTFRGYDSFHGYYSGQGTYTTHEASKYFDYHLDTSPDRAAEGVHSHELYVARARAVLDDHVAHHAGRPLFMLLALQSPHSPHEAPDVPYFQHYRRRGIFNGSSSSGATGTAATSGSNGGDGGAPAGTVYEVPGTRQAHAALLTCVRHADWLLPRRTVALQTRRSPECCWLDEVVKGRRKLSTCVGGIRYMDETVGRVVRLFEERGMWDDNTLFVFASDNGGCVTNLAPGCEGGASNFPFRGEKGSLYEGGVHVPAFVYSASDRLVPAALRGTASVEHVHVTDWLPTLEGFIARAAGAATGAGSAAAPIAAVGAGGTGGAGAAGASHPLDGVDVWPRIVSGARCPTTEGGGSGGGGQGGADAFERCAATPLHNRTILLNHDPYYEGSGLLAWPWKAIVHRSFVENCGWSVRHGGMDFAPLSGVSFTQTELFHLGRDPGETVNLAPLERAQVDAMMALLREVTADFATPRTAPEEEDFLLGDALADSVAVASGNAMTPWVVD